MEELAVCERGGEVDVVGVAERGGSCLDLELTGRCVSPGFWGVQCV